MSLDVLSIQLQIALAASKQNANFKYRHYLLWSLSVRDYKIRTRLISCPRCWSCVIFFKQVCSLKAKKVLKQVSQSIMGSFFKRHDDCIFIKRVILSNRKTLRLLSYWWDSGSGLQLIWICTLELKRKFKCRTHNLKLEGMGSGFRVYGLWLLRCRYRIYVHCLFPYKLSITAAPPNLRAV